MPQIAQLGLTILSQWSWLLLVLAVIYFFVGRGILPKVEATVDARDARIAGDLAEAARLQQAVEQSEIAWREKINAARDAGRTATDAAQAKGAAATEARVAVADTAIKAQLAEAEAALAGSRQSALAEIDQVAADAASDIVHRLTGTSVSQAEARAAVAGVMTNA